MLRKDVIAKSKLPVGSITNPQMVFNPTLVPSDDVTGRVNPVIPADSYYSVRVASTNAAVQKMVLFDPSLGYQLVNGWTLPANLVITGVSAPYQFMLNDLAHNASIVSLIKIRVSASPDVQFARPIEVYETSKGGGSKLIATLYPEKGVHEGQFQANISTFEANVIITNRTALVYMHEPGLTVTFNFYQVGELGRKA